MEKWIDEIEQRGQVRGEKIGERRGKILAYYDAGLSLEEISNKVNVSIDKVKKTLGLTPTEEKV